MPVVRTAKGRRSGEDSFQLTWTAPVETASPQTFSFAPNVTPGTYTAPPPSDEDDLPSESTLFPDSDITFAESTPASAPATTRRRRKGAKDDGDGNAQGHIPRPPNAFILFRSSFIKAQHVSSKIEGNHGTLSKIVGMLWHNLPYEERQVWQAKARRALADHRKKYPGYSFRPSAKDKDRGGDHDDSVSVTSSSTRDSSVPPPKRKQRETGPRDVARCEHIAALLAKGTKGRELEDAMKAFDAQRAPTVITPRFEEPLTAQQYEGTTGRHAKVKVEDEPKSIRQFRRSSSAPLLDVEHTENARKQSSFMARSVSPTTPTTNAPSASATDIPMVSRHTLTNTYRAQRKRSASSSPPCRPRVLLPQSGLPTINHVGHYPTLHSHASLPQLSVSTAMLPTGGYQQPTSAPAFSRQPTFGLGAESECTTPSNESFFDYDGSQTASWYQGTQSTPSTANTTNSDYSYVQTPTSAQAWSQPAIDFNFSFANASECPTPLSAVAPASYSPFEHAQAQQPATQVASTEQDVNVPLLLQPFAPAGPQVPQQQLTVETGWQSTEFDYEYEYSPSPLDAEIEREQYAFAHPAPAPMPQQSACYDIDMCGPSSNYGMPEPTSPSSASVSDGAPVTQVATPDITACDSFGALPALSAFDMQDAAVERYLAGASGKVAGHHGYGLGLDFAHLDGELSRYAEMELHQQM